MSGPPTSPEFREIRSSAAWVDLTTRGTLRATGSAAAAFVDKFATAPIGRLESGQGCEAFFTDVRGWVLAFATVLRTDDGLIIDCDAAVAGRLRDHLEHYHIREDVVLTDVSPAVSCVALAGPESMAWLRGRECQVGAEAAFRHGDMRLGPCTVHVVAVDWFDHPAFLLRVPMPESASLRAWLIAEGLREAGASEFDALRIEHRIPAAGDIPEKTLPQELDRTSRAISFTKGCYLGQETVARIDALGHVNRMLALVGVDAAPPSVGEAVSCDGEVVGVFTSSCMSPRLGACGLALVHRRGLEPQARLTVGGRAARIVAPST